MSGNPTSTVSSEPSTQSSEKQRVPDILAQPPSGPSVNAPSQSKGPLGAIYRAVSTALWRTVDIVVWTLDQSKPASRDFAHKVVITPVVVETKKNTPTAPGTLLGQRVHSLWIYKLLQRLKRDIVLSIIPTLDLLEGEVIRLDIHQAPYRDVVPRRIFGFWWAILLATSALTLLIGYAAQQVGGPFALGLFVWVIPILVFAWAAEERIHYQQWRLVITNWRTIMFMPTPRSHWLVDDVRLQAGRIQVVDVNYSPSRWWRLFQIATGARDLVISISGYGFKTNTAEVRDGLIIPDVMPEDVKKLEEIVFKK